MRGWRVGPAWVLLLAFVAEGQAQAQTRAATGRVAAGRLAATTADSLDRWFEAEEAFYLDQLRAQRGALLARAGWAELGDRCNPGALRIFPADTSPEQRLELDRLLERMEATIVGRGVGQSVDTPEGRALARAVVGWEAGIDRPVWDTDAGEAREAIAAGLTGELPDPRGTGCLPPPVDPDTVLFVLPALSDMPFPGAPRPRVKAWFGADGIRRIRDEFVAARGPVVGVPTDTLAYHVVAPMVIWREWAVLRVQRPVEPGGVVLNADGRGGATYLFRRVKGAWRLLAIVRSWGR